MAPIHCVHAQSVTADRYCADLAAKAEHDAAGGEVAGEEVGELGVDGRHDLVALLDERDPQPSGGQGLRHLQADVAGADDDG